VAKVEPVCKERLPDTGQGAVFIAEDRGVVRLTLSNPGKLNALTAAMWIELAHAFNTFSLRNDLRCIVVSGAGTEAFAAGADISEFETVRNTPAQVEQYHENIVPAALDAIAACDVPVVAAIQGACIGGGLEIASVCDIRVCNSGARFGAPVGLLGFPMAPREFRYLIRLFGARVVAELLLEGRIFDAAQAQRRGIVTEVFESETFDNALGRTVERVCRGSPLAARINKRQIRDFLDQAAPPSLAERREFYKFANSDDYRAGRVAFLQKGTPVFTGT
jgi:enoyl-CoA hydratase